MFYRIKIIASIMLVAASFQQCSKKPVAVSGDRVIVHSPGRSPVEVKVELAVTEAEREKGLMFRESLAPDAGMLFIFEREQQLWFWMKNTIVELDMIFIRADMTVLGCVRRANPQTTTARGVPGNSLYVLEVVGGFCEKNGVGEGTRMEFDLPSLEKYTSP